jgi:hypothetical protein
MGEKPGTFTIGRKEDRIITAFIPPLEEEMLFEATSSALPMHGVLWSEGERTIRGVVYEAGSPDLLDEKLDKMRQEVGDATGYEARPGVTDLNRRSPVK